MDPLNPRRTFATPLAFLLAAGALVLSLYLAFEVGTENARGDVAISNVWELQNMSNDLSADYYLTNDIDASTTSDWNSGAGFEPVGDGSNQFTGSLDGHGYNITGLFVDRTSTEYIGLFGHLDTGASLANLNLVQCDVSGKKYVGGLLGLNDGGSVVNSSTTGKVDGSMHVGGLVGKFDSGIISDTYSIADVRGDAHVAGLVGDGEGGTIENSFVAGSIDGDWDVGAIIGWNGGTTMEDCLFDNETTGRSSGAGGGSSSGTTGKYTSDMQKQSTFVDAGWDFENIWGIWEGGSYPFFKMHNMTPRPHITSADIVECFEDEEYHVDYEYIDPDSEESEITWNLVTNSTFLDLDSDTGILSGKPDQEDAGSYWLNISVSDGEFEDYHNFTLKVIEMNDSPVILTNDTTSCFEDTEHLIDYDAFDEEADTINWNLITNASFLSINHTTGILSGMPTQNDVGPYWVNVTASDYERHDFHNFTLMVIQINEEPTILTPDISQAFEDEIYSADYIAFDEEDDLLTWSIDSNASFILIGPLSGELVGFPLQQHIGSYYVNITVSDGEYMAYHNFTLDVIGVNDPPEITISSPANRSVVSGIVVLEGNVSDEDGNDTIEQVQVYANTGDWEAVSGLTYWTFDWDTSTLENGNYTLSFRAFDGTNHSKVKEILLNVNNSPPENKPPVITITSPEQGAEVSGTVTFKGSISDEDGSVEKVEIYIKQRGWLLTQMNGNTSWNFQWDTTIVDDGVYLIKVRSFDGTNHSEEVNITLTLKNEDDVGEDGGFLPGFGVKAVAGVIWAGAIFSSKKRKRQLSGRH